jgi:uncharacterized protein (DUF1778 family)
MNAVFASFDSILSREQKEFFEYAANLGGYKTLNEFIISSAQKRADEIIEKHQSILASRKDQEIFFQIIFNPPSPGKNLKKAAARYSKTCKVN